MLSTALAEVTVSSQVAPFFSVEGWLIVFPVYALHVLVLGHLVVVRNKPTAPLLWTAGILFGFYEFLITKVLWNPPWTTDPFQIAGVAIPELLVIGLFYHALMAFLMPLWIGERSLTNSHSIPLPERLGRLMVGKGQWVAPAVFGLVVAATSRERIVLSLTSYALVAVGIASWRRKGQRRWSLAELLPDRREVRRLAALLAALYAFAAVAFRPEGLPGPLGLFAMPALYAAVIVLFVRLARRSRSELHPEAKGIRIPMSVTLGSVFGGIVVGIALPAPIATGVMVAIIWGGGAIFGVVMLWGAVKAARKTVPANTH